MKDMKGRKSWVTGGFLFLVAALIGALVLTACAPSGNGGNGGNGDEPPPRPWVVRWGVGAAGMGGYLGLDPMSGADILKFLAGDMLSGLDLETHEPVLFLAAREEVNWEDGYTDHWIREGIPFHNGDIMTAEDVKFSFDRMNDEDAVGPSVVSTWSRFLGDVEVIDDYGVRVHWKMIGSPIRVVSPFQPVIVPKNYIEEVGWEAWADDPVMSGPMKVVDWERDVYIRLEKAFPEEGHWLWGDIPNYDELIIEVVTEPATTLAKLKTGELDIAGVGAASIPEVNADPNLTLAMTEYVLPWTILFFDYDNPGTPLNNPLVRKAVSLAIDREGIAENVFLGTKEPWGSYWAPYMLGYRYREPDPYDPDEARRLLEEAGYPDGFDTYFHYPQSDELSSQAVIASLAEVGIRAMSQPYEMVTWMDMYSNDQFDGMGYSPFPLWAGTYYPDELFDDELQGLGAPVGGDILEVGEAFWNIVRSETEEEMIAAAHEAEELVLDELGYRLMVWASHSCTAYGPRIEYWNPELPPWTATFKE